VDDGVQAVLAGVGPRLRELRARRGESLAAVSAATGISVSTLSRLESGGRRAALELLLPLAAHYEVTLDEAVRAPARPRGRRPVVRHGRTFYPLTSQPGGLQAFKQVIPGGPVDFGDELATHEGYEWIYVLSGRLRLRLGEQDLVLPAGEAAEFDTRVPHRVEAADDRPVELLTLFGPQGERMHVRARPAARAAR